jgi:hypothetical protein
VVKKTVRDIGGAQFPMLTCTNYVEWEVLMKVMLQARDLCEAVDVATDDKLAMEGILKSVPSEYRVALGSKKTTQEAWDALKVMRLGGVRARSTSRTVRPSKTSRCTSLGW